MMSILQKNSFNVSVCPSCCVRLGSCQALEKFKFGFMKRVDKG